MIFCRAATPPRPRPLGGRRRASSLWAPSAAAPVNASASAERSPSAVDTSCLLRLFLPDCVQHRISFKSLHYKAANVNTCSAPMWAAEARADTRTLRCSWLQTDFRAPLTLHQLPSWLATLGPLLTHRRAELSFNP